MSNEPMNDDDVSATRGDLRALKSELKAELASKQDLRALKFELKAELVSKSDLKNELRDVERRLSAELAQHANAIMEANRTDMRAMLDPLLSLPARVEKLEASKPRRRSAR